MKGLVAILLSAALCGCITRSPVPDDGVRDTPRYSFFTEDGRIRLLLTEDGYVHDWLVRDFHAVGTLSEFLSGIVAAGRAALPERTVTLRVAVRDPRPVHVPQTRWLTEADLAAIDDLVLQDIGYDPGFSLHARDEFLSRILILAERRTDYLWGIGHEDDGETVQVHFYPPEFSLVWLRVSYVIPDDTPIDFTVFPSHLPRTGPAVAYDRDTNIVVVIDREGGYLFRMMAAMKCEPHTIICIYHGPITRSSNPRRWIDMTRYVFATPEDE